MVRKYTLDIYLPYSSVNKNRRDKEVKGRVGKGRLEMGLLCADV